MALVLDVSRPPARLACRCCAAQVATLQRCHRCERWLCQECYVPWAGMVCPLCRHPAAGAGRHLRVVR